MSRWWKGAGLLVVAIAAVMIIPAFTAGFGASTGFLTSASGAGHSASPSHASQSASAALVSAALAAGAARHIPKIDMFLPNVHSAPTVSNGIVNPLYSVSPAPMGLGYFGVHDSHGVNVGTVTYFPSIEGAATINNVDPFYLASSSPDIFTMQLNTVLTQTEVLGNTSGV